MRTTLILNEDIYKKAAEMTGVKEKTALIHMGLQTLIAHEAARRLAKLGGSEKQLKAIRRRRF